MLLWSDIMDNNISVFSNIIFYSIAMATISNTSPITTSEDSQNDSETDLNDNTEDEMQTDTSNWTLAEKKKLQHMTDFHRNTSIYLVKKLLFIQL